MKLSIVIPFYNEEDNVEAVVREVLQAQPDAEVIAVDDGSGDRTGKILDGLSSIRVIHLKKNLGQSAALYAGLRSATGDICVMMDGDGQNDPADISKLIQHIHMADVICGYRAHRQDTWNRRIASRIANKIRSSLLGDGIRDTGCTLKAMKHEHICFLVPFNGLHRFMPALLKSAGLKIYEVPVNHRPRRAGQSKYTIAGRAWRGIYDLIGVGWLLKRQIRWPQKTEGV
jgi:dolichol-phosphate mannosyltransferase